MIRQLRAILVSIFFLSLCSIGFAQNAQIQGQVSDSSGAVIPKALVRVVNQLTGTERKVATNGSGQYVVPGLDPSVYKIFVQASGFSTAVSTPITLNVAQNAVLDFKMQVGSEAQNITVDASGVNINTTDASVSTVIDRSYVENMPLNGRSLQSLIALTPGVVNASPQTNGAQTGYSGEFSVNGQRTDANYYSVDGVSATVGAYASGIGSPATGGALPSESALGTTHNLVSIDSLQEFRIDTSTYTAESGRFPGAQLSFVTRSGTNKWHGSISEYLRNTAFDANNWFNNYNNLPNTGERQNDFGGTFGGPLRLPRVYDGRNRTFFFFSYEGLRLVQPTPAQTTYVPDMELRNNPSLSSNLKPVIDSFPVPNGPETGDGLAVYVGAASLPSNIDSTSFRIDHTIGSKHHLFFRFANSDSNTTAFTSGSLNFTNNTIANTRNFTFGGDSQFSNTMTNALRLNYTRFSGNGSFTPVVQGGGQAVDLAQLAGVNPATYPTYNETVSLNFDSFSANAFQGGFVSPNAQWNLIDNLSFTRGAHQFKLGLDYRRLKPTVNGENPEVYVDYDSEASVLTNSADFASTAIDLPVYPVFINTSVFVQDTWKVTPRLTLNMGLRWELNPAPGNRHHTAPYTLTGSDPNALTIAPYGTSLWQTSWHGLAPRLGAAWLLRTTSDWETVLRVGGGLFYDTAQDVVGRTLGQFQPGYSAQAYYGAVYGIYATFPLTNAQVYLPVPNPPVPPYSIYNVYYYPKNLALPYTFQWNASIQQSLGGLQALTVSFVGSHATKLLQTDETPNDEYGYASFVHNGLTNDYDALQIQFQRNLSHGLQALGAYTWSHCIDYSSTDLSFIYQSQRGNCDYDVRHTFSTAFSYNLPTISHNLATRAVLGHWGLDDRFTARTAYPVELYGNYVLDPATGHEVLQSLNVVPDVPLYLYGTTYPGGKSINPAAFTPPPPGSFGDQPRNSLRAFGAWQNDVALRRDFVFREGLDLKFRAEAFNVTNHPNFGQISANYCSPGPGCFFGQSIATLNTSLGGLSPLYQLGGPRSLQLSLRLSF